MYLIERQCSGIVFSSDLNSYYTWATTLNNTQVAKMFGVLKELGNIFIVDGSNIQELKDLVHDQERFQGQLRLDEIYELVSSRVDYKKVKGALESKECVIS